MTTVLLGGVLVAVLAGWALASIGRYLRARWFLVRMWRFLSGEAHHGHPITDAGWFRAGERALTRTGHATRFWHLPRWKRAAYRTGGTLGFVAVLAGLFASPQVTALIMAACFTTAVLLLVWLAGRRVAGHRRRRTWLHPLHLAVHEIAGIPRAHRAESWIKAELDDTGAVKKATLELPPGWPADDKDKGRLVAIASAKLGIEAPEAAWRSAGPEPQLCLEQSQPPPRRVSLADIREHLDKVRQDELIWGLGKRSALVTTSLSGDSPHLGLSMGSGAGKSVTARGLLAQRLYRGDIGLILDYKMISHQWARDLPNVVIARRPAEIHAALCWLGGDPTRNITGEIERRNEVALAGADMDGNVHAVVGPRLIVVCEELNATVARLRAYWREIRHRDDPVRSPALEALDAVSFMGRQVLVNVIYIGQRLSVKASGGDGDARENIGCLAFGRYSASNWKMLADGHPMPAKSLTPGRIQVVTDKVRETQGVFMSAREARALALAGEMSPLPAGMPGAKAVLAAHAAQISGPDQGVVLGQVPQLGPVDGQRVTLSQAVSDGIVSCSLHAIRKAAQRDEEFPDRRGWRGTAAEYDPLSLAEWDAGRR